ncbi:exonuclease domain-containing protein [Sulfurimonas sp.]|uniref:exonuclease domain-containing protein n=1 Tax=Sulfurimonas sp. TaxID=2022749 RepID=UPI00260B0592|nr:exonuclease domain-containing protein [Sulfurimonas sp.]
MLIFIDVETTGLEESDRLCSVALLDKERARYELLNEGKKIPSIASSIHHITNEMIQDKAAFEASEIYKYLNECNKEENTLVAHNASFDLKMLASSGFVWQGDVIDTLKVTKHLISECELFSLQFLRYDLKLYKEEDRLLQKYGIKDALCSHNALADVVVTKLLFEYLLDISYVDSMKELSFKPVLLQKLTFGKYLGHYIEDIANSDRGYLMWLLSLSELDEDLRYSIEYYIEG